MSEKKILNIIRLRIAFLRKDKGKFMDKPDGLEHFRDSIIKIIECYEIMNMITKAK